MRPTPANMPLPERMAVLTPITSETCCAHTTPRNHSPPRHHCSATALHCCLIHHVGMKRRRRRPSPACTEAWIDAGISLDDSTCRGRVLQTFDVAVLSEPPTDWPSTSTLKSPRDLQTEAVETPSGASTESSELPAPLMIPRLRECSRPQRKHKRACCESSCQPDNTTSPTEPGSERISESEDILAWGWVEHHVTGASRVL